MPLRIDGWYSRSVASVEWDEEQQAYVMALDEKEEKEQARITAWLLIFVDFIFLAAVTKLADIVINCSLSIHTIMFVAFLLTVMFTTRLWFDDYYNRFYENDLFHRILFFAYALCSFIMVLNINAVQTNGHPSDLGCRADLYGIAFGGGFLATRFIMVILYVSVTFSDPKMQALRQFWGHMLTTALSFLIALSLVLVEYSNPADVKPAQRINTYIACMVVEFAYHTWHHYSLAFASFLRNVKCPCSSYLQGKEVYLLNTQSYQDRIGAFVMVILGEVLVKNLIRYYDVAYEEQTYGYSCASMVIVFLYGILYYDATKAEGDDHALTHSILSSYLYIWSHLLLSIACFFTNAAIGVLFELDMPMIEEVIAVEEEPSDDQALMFRSTHKPIFTASTLLGTSMGVSLIIFAFMNLLHRGISQLCGGGGKGDNAVVRRDFALKFGFAILHFVIPAMNLDGIHMITLHATLLALVVFFEIRFPKIASENKEANVGTTEHGDGEGKDEEEQEQEEEEEDVIPYSRSRRRARVRNDYEYEEGGRRVRHGGRRERDHGDHRHQDFGDEESESGVLNTDRRGASRRQSLQMQAQAASPKDAHLMTMAAPKANPLDRRGSLLATRSPGSYQESVDKRKSRISALAVSAEKVHSQSHRSPMH